jgi:hypothetical protein
VWYGRRGSKPTGVVPGCERSADRWREQQGHSPGLALVPSGDQAFRVREHLSVGRAPGGSRSVGFGLPLTFQLSPIKPHGRIVAEPGRMSTTPLRATLKVALGGEAVRQSRFRNRGEPMDHETRQKIIRQWMALPKDQATDGRAGGGLVQEDRRAERISARPT